MNKNINKSLLVAAIGSLFVASAAHATNGYFSDGTGAKNRGMGGAGTALAQEAGSMALNPAATVNMDPRMDVSVGIFSPKPRGYTIAGNDVGLNGAQESDANYFPIPFFGQNFKIDNVSSWGVTVTALGGMNTRFATNPFASFGATGVLGIDLKQVTLSGLYARKINDKLSLGIAAGMTYQAFEARGLGIFGGFGFSLRPTQLSNNGHDTSTGLALKLGATYDVTKDVTVGFSYAPETNMKRFKKYAGLFAENGDFNIPSNYNIGVAMQVSPKVLVAVDYKKINYTDVAAISNDAQRLTSFSGPSCATGTASMCLGGAQGAGFGWDDMDIIKLGVAYTASSDITYRAGWNHGGSPIKSEDAVLNIIAPATVENHLTLGMTKRLNATSEITVDFIHSFENSVTGDVPDAFSTQNGNFTAPNPANPAGTPGTATITMEQNFIEVSYGKKF